MTSLRQYAWAACLLLTACAADKPTPKPLEPLEPKIAGRLIWSERVSGVRFPLAIAVNGGVFTVAGDDGGVLALDASTGRSIWRAEVGATLSAGVGSDGRFAAVVTRGGELVVVEAGKVLWRKVLGVRVSSAPLVAGERVFVLAVDRSVYAFDVFDGRRLWASKRPGDPLTLAHSGALLPMNDTLLVGQGPRLAGLDPLRGSLRWEIAVATPRGANEVERLADLVGPVARVGKLVCARAFQSAVGCVDGERAALLWSKNVGGTHGVAGDEQMIYGADASDRLSAWRIATGELAWSSEVMLYRGLTAPLRVGKALVFGDAEGLVHWLSPEKGEPLLRLPTDGSAVAATPALAGTTMLVATRNGGLFAFGPE
ncbi:MAG: outer membrane protein assembly factor BamB [Burkholderiaceae bacterium]